MSSVDSSHHVDGWLGLYSTLSPAPGNHFTGIIIAWSRINFNSSVALNIFGLLPQRHELTIKMHPQYICTAVTIQRHCKNLHLNQKGVMNQLLASIWLMNNLRLIWIQSVSMCYYFCRSQSNEIYTKYEVKCKILPISHL